MIKKVYEVENTSRDKICVFESEKYYTITNKKRNSKITTYKQFLYGDIFHKGVEWEYPLLLLHGSLEGKGEISKVDDWEAEDEL